MKKILFLTTYSSPYRVRFFDELGKQAEVTVLFSDRKEAQSHRAGQWFEDSKGYFRSVQLEKSLCTVHGKQLCRDVLSWLKKPWDHIIICGYSSPTSILAMKYLRMKKIPFCLEVDGGVIRPDSGLKYRFKKSLVGGASGWLASGEATKKYLVHYGAKPEKTFTYPFTSLMETDLRTQPASQEEKLAIRQQLSIEESRVILSVGQFIHRKGFDVLLKAAAELPSDVGIYIVGGLPTEEYLQMHRELGLTNVHFAGFKKKEQLQQYYLASDLFVLPTREDIWGLVINEAMACGLPVVTTDQCVAGVELVENGVSGYIVPAGAPEPLAEKMLAVLKGNPQAMGAAALQKIKPYTIENMARVHMDILEGRKEP